MLKNWKWCKKCKFLQIFRKFYANFWFLANLGSPVNHDWYRVLDQNFILFSHFSLELSAEKRFRLLAWSYHGLMTWSKLNILKLKKCKFLQIFRKFCANFHSTTFWTSFLLENDDSDYNSLQFAEIRVPLPIDGWKGIPVGSLSL